MKDLFIDSLNFEGKYMKNSFLTSVLRLILNIGNENFVG